MTDKQSEDLFEAAAEQLREAANARKCWDCACLKNTLNGIENALPLSDRPSALQEAMTFARTVLQPPVIECRGCDVCFPSVAINLLSQSGGENGLEISACPAEKVEARDGWPPFPGSYSVLRFHAPIAICTLTDDQLAESIAKKSPSGVAIIGTMQTENLGIERLVQNILANPNIRFLIVCGEDSRRRIGHLPGASIVALARNGVNERLRIIDAPGKRPVLKNLPVGAVEHFCTFVEVVNLVGESSHEAVISSIADCLTRDPGPALPCESGHRIVPIPGRLPEVMVSDPAGYFVIYVDRRAGMLSLEHFHNTGVLNLVVEGSTAAELYITAIERDLVTRLDHAAYLGRELARAEESLHTGHPYVQDAAPEARQNAEPKPCGCGSQSGGRCR